MSEDAPNNSSFITRKFLQRTKMDTTTRKRERQPPVGRKESTVVRIKKQYADDAKRFAEEMDPKSNQQAVLNSILEKGGIKTLLKGLKKK